MVSHSDIVHHMSKITRYNGALPGTKTYSVAEHSINIAQYFINRNDYIIALHALIHDASEAYMGDLPSPLKALLPEYKKIEKHVENEIHKYYKDFLKHCYNKELILLNKDQEKSLDYVDKNILLNEVATTSPKNCKEYERLCPTLKAIDGVDILYNADVPTIKAHFNTLFNMLVNKLPNCKESKFKGVF